MSTAGFAFTSAGSTSTGIGMHSLTGSTGSSSYVTRSVYGTGSWS